MNLSVFLLSGAIGLAAATTAAQAMPVGALKHGAVADAATAQVLPVYHRGRPHRRSRVTVHPRGHYYAAPDGPYYYDDLSQYPYTRGFMDPNPALRGNLRGCTVDLGYGRYESCDGR